MTAQQIMADRVREALAGRTVREVRMFGGLAFMVENKLAVSVGPAADLLIRATPEEYDGLLERGAVPAMMGPDRHMGRRWVVVPAERLDDAGLDFWLEVAIAAGQRSRGTQRTP